ncbi:hypothetical protein [Sphingobium sp.]|uniref:hypothetical protein n=1 Tax=Sphingobium sp. TaxID=1912891 RepID=UPI0028BE4E99|nr:hypothetical protein [Sphingobium sp.]
MRDDDVLVRRSIALASPEAGVVTAWLEDNFHHFGVRLMHDGNRVTRIAAATIRFPWTTCGGAGQPLKALEGQALIARPDALSTLLPMQFQCTHLFELAALAMVHAAHGDVDRRYDMVVRKDSAFPGRHRGTMGRDGRDVLCMDIDGSMIQAPAAYSGHDLYKGFRKWLAGFSDEEAVTLWLMRRLFWLSAGLVHFKPRPVAAGTGMGALCHTYQPEQRYHAYAMNTIIDVTDTRVTLLSRR